MNLKPAKWVFSRENMLQEFYFGAVEEVIDKTCLLNQFELQPVWPVKSRKKLPKNNSTRKMKDFDNFTKIA